MRFHEVLENRTDYAAATLNSDIDVPGFAIGALFYWDVATVAGTTPIADLSMQFWDPSGDEFIPYDNGAFPQVTANDTQAVLAIHPRLGNDATGTHLTTSAMLGSRIRAAFVFDRTTGNETYTFTLSVDWLSD